MCTLCSYNPLSAFDGSHENFTSLAGNALPSLPPDASGTYYVTDAGITTTRPTEGSDITLIGTLDVVDADDWTWAASDDFTPDVVARAQGDDQPMDHDVCGVESDAFGSVGFDEMDPTEETETVSMTPENGTLTELANFLTSGYWSSVRHWNLGDSGRNAKDGVLTYTLDGYSGDSNGLSAARAELARESFRIYEEVLGIDFVETSDPNADFRFGDNQGGAYASYSYSNSGGVGYFSSARINVASSWSGGSSAYNSYTFQTFLHEIGHALGLGHQGPYNGSASFPNSASFGNDSWQASMMSYFSQRENPSTGATSSQLLSPMAVDWLALDSHYKQYGFGVSGAFAGNTIYGFNTNIAASTSQVFHDLADYADRRAFTIIDSGGNDTLDFSGYSQNQRIDLTVSQAENIQATTSDIGTEIGNLTLAVGTVIENAIGGDGDDIIIGNEYRNSLSGGAGNDELYAGDQIDYLNGGAGADKLFGGTGTTFAVYSDAAGPMVFDLLNPSNSSATFAEDTLVNVQAIVGAQNFSNQFVGDDTRNFFFGGTDSDIFYGGGELDILRGAGGDDTLFGGEGRDILIGNGGADILNGGCRERQVFLRRSRSRSRHHQRFRSWN